ncbi:MAG: phosphoribosyltransferase [Acidobacteriaceae bacterium]
MARVFEDRRDAGRALARLMRHEREWKDAIVLGLPRGGVPVAFEVARSLGLPLDVLVVRKLGAPGHEELAMGAVASGGTRVVNEPVMRELEISPQSLEAVAQREALEVERREKAYRGGRPPAPIEGRTTILVDDGLATGASMMAAARAVRPVAREVVVAVPVGARTSCAEMSREVDEVICASKPERFMAVGMFYRNFQPTTDEEVRSLLAEARFGTAGRAAQSPGENGFSNYAQQN